MSKLIKPNILYTRDELVDYKYVDCYMLNDTPGFPTATYEIAEEDNLNTIVAEMEQYFWRVVPTSQTNGQSVQKWVP